MEFRKDINGLRALAILPVVLFHFGLKEFAGGFVGVDIFFVISGFLMTGIIFSRLDTGTFNLWGFYLDRARRIIPAQAFLCAVLLFIGWFALPPAEYLRMARAAFRSVLFISNFIFAQRGGYFDPPAHFNWFLHTWSLSLEWQFYLIYPLVIISITSVLSRQGATLVLVGLALGSFLLSCIFSPSSPISSFYLLPTRAWEMLAGGLVYLSPLTLNRHKKVLCYAGLLLICGSVFLLSENDVWPGWLAVLPVTGTALVITAREEQSVLTTLAPVQLLGRISYSVYLWHWPIAVAVNYFGHAGRQAQIAGIMLSFMLGHLSYRYVERSASTKDLKRAKWWRRAYVPLGSATAIVLLSQSVIRADGVPARMSRDFNRRTQNIMLPMVNNGWCYYSVDSISSLPVGAQGLNCKIGLKTGPMKGLIFGDSYAGQYDPMWDRFGKSLKLSINSISTNWCYPSLGDGFTGPKSSRAYAQCILDRQYLRGSIKKYGFVILAGQWGNVYRQGHIAGVLKAIRYAAARVPLVIVMPSPKTFDANIGGKYETSLILGRKFDISNYSTKLDADARMANSLVKRTSSALPNVVYIARNLIFQRDGKPSDVSAEGVPYSWDGFHISTYGSLKAAESFQHTNAYKSLVARIKRSVRPTDASL